jgi:methylated-DNA-protein-cysteine methyltransferase-like protein
MLVKKNIANSGKIPKSATGKISYSGHRTTRSSAKKNSSPRTIFNHSSAKKILPARKTSENSTPKLNTVRPSGKRDDSFFELVYEIARQIPYGRVTSYGAIAACLGTKLSARMVGWAMNGADKVNPTVPAHRVVNRVGLLSGKHHFKPPGRMEKLLKKEGIQVIEDMIVNFREKFWDPVKFGNLEI